MIGDALFDEDITDTLATPNVFWQTGSKNFGQEFAGRKVVAVPKPLGEMKPYVGDSILLPTVHGLEKLIYNESQLERKLLLDFELVGSNSGKPFVIADFGVNYSTGDILVALSTEESEDHCETRTLYYNAASDTVSPHADAPELWGELVSMETYVLGLYTDPAMEVDLHACVTRQGLRPIEPLVVAYEDTVEESFARVNDSTMVYEATDTGFLIYGAHKTVQQHQKIPVLDH